MDQSTAVPSMESFLRDRARDFNIFSKALAFAYCIVLMADGKDYLHATRRDIEAATGIDHSRWPEAKARALGVYLVHRGSNEWVDGHGLAGTWRVRQFAPIGVSPNSLVQNSMSSYSVMDRLSRSDGGEVSHPASTIWDDLGQYRYDGWRLDLLLGRQDVAISAKDLPWLPVRTAQRFLAKARQASLVKDGNWLGSTTVAYMAEALGPEALYRLDYARAKAKTESAANAYRVFMLTDKVEAAITSFLVNLDLLVADGALPAEWEPYVGNREMVRPLYEPQPEVVVVEPVVDVAANLVRLSAIVRALRW